MICRGRGGGLGEVLCICGKGPGEPPCNRPVSARRRRPSGLDLGPGRTQLGDLDPAAGPAAPGMANGGDALPIRAARLEDHEISGLGAGWAGNGPSGEWPVCVRRPAPAAACRTLQVPAPHCAAS